MTDKTKEALKLAMDAICGSGDFLFNWHECEPNNEREMQRYQETLEANEKAFKAIREALAEQPAIKQDLTPEQPDMNLNCKSVQARLATSWGYVKAEQPAQQQEIDWKDQYEKQKRRAEMWVAKYEADIGPLEKAIPVAAQQQEPVAWRLKNDAFDYGITSYDKEQADAHINQGWRLIDTLYTSPPAQRKPWVGLTDKEIAQGCKESWVTKQAWQSAVWWAEAKLREKNA